MARLLRRSPALTLCAALVTIPGYSAAAPDTAFGDQGTLPGVISTGARGADTSDDVGHQTLEAALMLAGQSIAKLPIVLVSVTPDTASPGVQGWTSRDDNGKADRIFLYTGNGVFRCARPSNGNYQCILKLASVLVHEAWHFRHGADEAEAYAAQIVFLMGNGGALDQIADVRMSRDLVVAASRAAREAARTRYRNQSR